MKKSIFLNIKWKGWQPNDPSSSNHLLVTLLRPNKIFRCDLNYRIKRGEEGGGGGGGVWAVTMGCVKSKSFV